MEKKVTTMVIKVDLSCEKCLKKIKKVFSKIPQIEDQIYDEKANTVTVKVLCCSPESVQEKIYCKGGKSVKGIEIKVPKKEAKAKSVESDAKTKQKGDKNPAVEPPKNKDAESSPKPKAPEVAPKASEGHPKTAILAARSQAPEASGAVIGYPPPVQPSIYLRQGYEGYGHCPPHSYEGYAWRPVYDSWGCGGGHNYEYYNVNSSSSSSSYDYLSDENPSACIIM